MTKLLEPTPYSVIDGRDVKALKIKSIEGVLEQGFLTLKPLIVGQKILVLEVFRKKGLKDPVHKHTDHDSAGYLIKGKMKIVIGGHEHIVNAGSAWYHPANVEHFSEALEDCIQIEIKSPPMKTWEE